VLARPASAQVNKNSAQALEEKEKSEAEAQRMRELRAAERAARGPRTRGVLFVYTESGALEQVLTAVEKVEAEERRRAAREGGKDLSTGKNGGNSTGKREKSAVLSASRVGASAAVKASAGVPTAPASASTAPLNSPWATGATSSSSSSALSSSGGPSTLKSNSSLPASSAVPLVPAWQSTYSTLSTLGIVPQHENQPATDFDILREAESNPKLEVGAGSGALGIGMGMGMGIGVDMNMDMDMDMQLGAYPPSLMNHRSSEFVPGVGWITGDRQQSAVALGQDQQDW
jgi:hypothetical protein